MITSPLTFLATSNSILYVGAKPVFVDINPETLNLDPDLIEDQITERTKKLATENTPTSRWWSTASARKALAKVDQASRKLSPEYMFEREGS